MSILKSLEQLKTKIITIGKYSLRVVACLQI